jgi:hypothetical protein
MKGVFAMNKKLTLTLVAMVVVSLMLAPMALAKGKNGQAGKSNVAHLYLYEKDPGTWEIVKDGAWGKMQYRIKGRVFRYVFNGHNLEPGTDYQLIYYPDPWPGDGLICLGCGTANEWGNIHIKGVVDTGDLPIEADENEGAKIWLVVYGDVNCEDSRMIGWNPEEYLFEYDLITFIDVDGIAE